MNQNKNRFIAKLKAAIPRKRRILQKPNLTRAAVLVPIVYRENTPHFILTKRAMTVSTHKGQIAFPGGVFEPTDHSETDTAIRETEEEIGLARSAICPIGLMDDISTTSGFVITPVVALVEESAVFSTAKDEVDELFELPLSAFQNSNTHRFIEEDHGGKTRRYHSFQVGQRTVWGATAGIIHQLMQLLGK